MLATKLSVPANPVLRYAIMFVACLEVLLGLFAIFSAATTWTDLPTNPIVIAYFTFVLIVLPLLAVWALVLAYKEERLGLAAVLAAIQPVFYALVFYALRVVLASLA